CLRPERRQDRSTAPETMPGNFGWRVRIDARERSVRKRSEESSRHKRATNTQCCNRRLAAFYISLVVPKNRVAALQCGTTATKSRSQQPQDNSTESASNRPQSRHLIFHACLAARCPTTPVSPQPDQGASTVGGRGSRCRGR